MKTKTIMIKQSIGPSIIGTCLSICSPKEPEINRHIEAPIEPDIIK